jgi:hypothetical protein
MTNTTRIITYGYPFLRSATASTANGIGRGLSPIYGQPYQLSDTLGEVTTRAAETALKIEALYGERYEGITVEHIKIRLTMEILKCLGRPVTDSIHGSKLEDLGTANQVRQLFYQVATNLR